MKKDWLNFIYINKVEMLLGNCKQPILKLYCFLTFCFYLNEQWATLCHAIQWFTMLRGLYLLSVVKSLTYSSHSLLHHLWLVKGHGNVGTGCLFFHAWTMNSRNNNIYSFKEFVLIQLQGFQNSTTFTWDTVKVKYVLNINSTRPALINTWRI